MKEEKHHPGAQPLHRRIAQSIQEDIKRRNLAAHTKIPSEVQLARQYGVSHGTITKALESLVHTNVLYRQRPRGTFVAGPPLTEQTQLPTTDAEQTPTAAQVIKQAAIKKPAQHEESTPPYIGIIIPSLGSGYMDGVVTSVENMTRSAGYGLSFAHFDEDLAMERYHVEQFLKQGVVGMIIFPGEHKVEIRDGRLISPPEGQPRIDYLRLLQQHDIPFVVIDRYIPEIDCNYVVSDDFSAGYAATQHLIAQGRQRIGFVSAHYFLTSSYYRYLGYKQCLQDYQRPLDERLVLQTLEFADQPVHPNHPLNDTAGLAHDRSRITAYLQTDGRPDAVIAMNELLALQILQSATTLGLAIPDDLALVCSGETSIGAYTSVPFTAIVQPVNEIGRQSAAILLNLIAGRLSGIRKVVLPVSLVIRKSSGAHPNTVPQLIPRHMQ